MNKRWIELGKRLAVLIPLTSGVMIGAYFLIRQLFTAYPLPPQLAPFASMLGASMALVGTISTIVLTGVFTRDKGDDSEAPPFQPPKDPDFEANKSRYKAVAEALWKRKEWYKSQTRLEGAAAVRYRSRVYIWRTAFAFAVFQYFAGLGAATAVAAWLAANGHNNGTPGVTVPWYLDYLNLMLLAGGAVVVPGLMYRRYLRGRRSNTVFEHALAIGPGAVFFAGLLFFLQMTPEIVAFINGGSVNPKTKEAVAVPPIPFFSLPASLNVPPFVYVAIQKLLVLPFVSLCTIMVYWLAVRDTHSRLVFLRSARSSAPATA